jgi:hypothetical protein
MISKDDIIGFCGLDPAEIDAIAVHEHIPDVAAAALGEYLLHAEHGPDRIRDMIVEDLRAALAAGRSDQASTLYMALRHFLETHPEAA